MNLAEATSLESIQGITTSDARGTRQSTLMFQQGTEAELAFPDGSTQPIDELSIRITEFTAGPDGRAAMPAELPPGVGYTYCASLTVDQALSLGASEVHFSKPVVNYVENFIGFETGIEVPVYYYNFSTGQWQQSSPGRVIEIVSVTGGLANVDIDGDGLADDPAALQALGFNDDERQELAELYTPGTSLWRTQLNHFSTIDYNFPYDYPDSDYPDPPVIRTNDTEDDSCEQEGASVIECQSQVLGEFLPIAGTPFSLNYRSNRTEGRSIREFKIPIKAASCDFTSVQIQIAGKIYEDKFPCIMTDYDYDFTWDGKDAYGREVQGAQPISVRIGYWYQQKLCGRRFNPVTSQWDKFCRTIPDQYDILKSAPAGAILNYWDARGQGLGGWTLNIHHAYNASTGSLFTGTGQRSSGSNTGNVVFPAAAGYSLRSSLYLGLAVGPEGDIYVADKTNHRVFLRKADTFTDQLKFGEIIAGQVASGFSGDGGPAIDASLSSPTNVALGPNGLIYISDTGNHRIRKIDENGIITTIAGNGSGGSSGDGGPATDAALGSPEWLAAGPDGSIFVSTNNRLSIRRIAPNGLIETVFSSPSHTTTYGTYYPVIMGLAVDGNGVLYTSTYISYNNGGWLGANCIYKIMPDGTYSIIAGTGDLLSSGDGGLAIDATMNPRGLAVGDDGSIFVADINLYNQYDQRIRRISPDGFISSIAGCKLNDAFCDSNGVYNRELARNSYLNTIYDITLDTEQNLYISSFARIYKIASPRPGMSFGEISVPNGDGSEIYTFSSTGKHLKTQDTLTGSVKYLFNYNSQGLLESIENAFGNVTTIERDTAGNLLAITGPYGHRTAFTLNQNGYVATATNPNNEVYNFAYSDLGLLTSTTSPNNHTSTYTYDVAGLLLTDNDAAGGSWTLSRTEKEFGYETSKTSGLNRTSSYLVENLPSGEKHLLNTTPDSLAIEGTREAGRQVITRPDGSTITVAKSYDPRFGMQSPLTKTMQMETPGGHKSQVSATRTVVLTDDTNPLSLETLTENKDVNSRRYSISYDASTRTTTRTSPEGRVTTTTIDSNGNRITRKIGDQTEVNIGYDSTGRMSSISQGARTFSITYNNDGFVASITDPLSRPTTYEYDSSGRLTKKTFPDGRFVEYSYDANGNLLSYITPKGAVHNFSYTQVNKLNSYTAPNIAGVNGVTTYNYNLDRQLESISRPDGTVQNIVYDSAGRMQNNGGVTFSYNGTTGNMSSLTTADGDVITLAFDGMFPTLSSWTGTVTGEFSQEIDNNFNVTSRSINAGNTIAFSYDNDNLIIQAGDLGITRDAFNGFVTATTLGTIVDSRSYDGFGKPAGYNSNYSGNPLFATSYTRDNISRITQINETVGTATKVYTFTYDAAGRINAVSIDGSSTETYTYDTNGNILSKNATSATYDNQDRLTTWGSTTYTYTANGEIQTKVNGTDTTTFEYDSFGKLKQVVLPDARQIDYIVDGFNRRIGKKIDGALVQGLLYKDELNPVAELDGSNQVVSRFIYATRGNVPDYMIKNGETYRIISDHLGSPRLVTRVTDGLIAQQIEYDAYGNITQDTNPGFQPFGFAGGLYDPDTGLVRFGARDYEPQTGRWTTKDSVFLNSQGMNLYAYAYDNPVNFTDQTGADPNDPPVHQELPIELGMNLEEREAYTTCRELYFRQRHREECFSNEYRRSRERDFLCAQSGYCEENPYDIWMRECMWERWAGITPIERERSLIDILTDFYQEHFTSQPEPFPTVGTGGGVRF